MSISNLTNNGQKAPEWYKFRFNELSVDGAITAASVSGTSVNATSLQSIPVSAVAPIATEVLTYNGVQWAPAAAGGGGGLPYSGGTQDLYINSIGGSDLNDGLSAVNAVQTWPRLLEIGSEYNVDEIIIHLVAGQTLSALTSTLDTPLQEYDDTVLYTFNNVLDFSPLGARSIKVITDLVSPTTLTPSASANWSTTTSGPVFKYFDHSSLTGLVGANRWLYRASDDQYYSTLWTDNGSTRTYCINPDGTLASYTFYDNSQIATISLSGNTLINAPNKSVVFERLILEVNNSIKLNGSLTLKGCSIDTVIAFLSGYELLLESCFVNVLVSYFGTTNMNYVYSDNSISYRINTSGSLSYCYIGTFAAIYNSRITMFHTEFIEAGGIEIGINSAAFIEGCGTTTNNMEVFENANVKINLGVFQEVQFNVYRNSSLIVNDMDTTCAVSVSSTSGSKVYLRRNDLTPLSTQPTLFSADEHGEIEVDLGTIQDIVAGTPTGNPFISCNDFSLIRIKSSPINTTTNRTGRIINMSDGAKVWLPNFTITSALTTDDIILIDNYSELYLSSTTSLNTSQNMILVRGASKILSLGTPVNAGAGTVLQRGSSVAGAFSFDTTFGGMVSATDDMTLVLNR